MALHGVVRPPNPIVTLEWDLPRVPVPPDVYEAETLRHIMQHGNGCFMAN